MTNEIDERNKIIKSFFVIGLNESMIRKYEEEEESSTRFVQDIDILVQDLPKHYTSENSDEKYILLNEKKHVWLRIKYSLNYHSPITDLQIAECDYESKEFLLLEKRYIDENCYPMMVTYHKKDINESEIENDENKNKVVTFPIISEFKFHKEYSDVYVKIPSDLNIKNLIHLPMKSPCAIFLITRRNESLPFKDISIIKKGGGNFNLARLKHKSPYTYKYIPEILDQYPPNIETNSSVSMFCFPEGIHISNQYRMPSWFTFVLTDEIGKRTYGSTIIFWEEMDIKLKENFIPFFDEYDPKTQKRKYYFIQKAICVLSKFPFYHNCLHFLKQLYRIQTSSKSLLPLERVICSFVDSLYLRKQEIVQYIIGEEKLDFYKIANYGELWDTNNDYLEVLFRVLSFKQIVTAWQALLLEKKLFLLCSSKATLACVAHGLINLLFPFKWIHVFIPILPEKLKSFIDTPIPLIIGISFPCDLNEFPNDAIILNINKNKFENYFNTIPKLKGKLQALLEIKLKNLKEKYGLDNPIKSEKWMDFQDEVSPSFELDKYTKVDHTEIRDAFYSIFISMFKNYSKFLVWNNIEQNLDSSSQNLEDIIETCFKKKEFLKSHSSTEENDFISIFSETSLFNQFFEPFLKFKTDGPMGYFLECIKNRKNDKKAYLQEIIPEKIKTLPEIDISDLKGEIFFHVNFPSKLEKKLYIQIEKPKKPFKSKFIKYQDEWCFDISKLKKREWAHYLLYAIYEIWFHFFSFVIHFYPDEESNSLMKYAFFLLEDLCDNKKIVPTRCLFSKIFKSCARSNLKNFVKKILSLVSKTYKNTKYKNLFCNSYLSGLYALTENVGANSSLTLGSANSYLNITAIRTAILNEIYADNYDNRNFIDDIIFINSKICSNCVLNKKKLYKIGVEKILAGFSINKENSYIICPECLYKIEPYIYYLEKSKNNLKPRSFKLYHPQKLLDELDNLINDKGEIFFYKKLEENQYDLYLSVIFYFKLFDLPLLILYRPKNKGNNIMYDFEEQLELNKQRKSNKKSSKSDKNKRLKSISPDRVSKSPDRSSDRQSYISGEYTDYSRKSTLSNISELESEIWKNIKNNLDNKNIYNKINSEERTEFNSRIKDMRIVLGKYVQYFVSESKENLDIFLSRLNQKTENEVEFDFKNNIGTINKNNINNIKILKDEQTKKIRKIDNNIANMNFNLEKKKEEDKNEIKRMKSNDNGNFLGMFEDEKEEEDKKDKKINNNWINIKSEKEKEKEKEKNDNINNDWMEKQKEKEKERNNNINNKNNINIISQFDEIEEKRKMSSIELSFNKNKNLKEISSKNEKNEIKIENNNNDLKEKEKEENKTKKIEEQKEEEPNRKKSEVVKRKKKITIKCE